MAPAPVKPARPPDPSIPDLGIVRYRDPQSEREIWLGLEVGGMYLPKSAGVFDRDVWTQRTVASWAFAFSPWLAVGGRHGLVLYDASNIRLQVHEHQLELSGRPLFGRRLPRVYDRLAVGVELHTLKRTWVGGEQFIIGGVRDVVATLGYGIDHKLTRRWWLGWNLQGRYVWVFLDTQRQLRLAIRPAIVLRERHRLAVELAGFLVHRDERQFGEPFARVTAHGQAAFEYTWMSRKYVGTFVAVRYATGFMSGQAPMYEIREEAINAHYGELQAGIRAAW